MSEFSPDDALVPPARRDPYAAFRSEAYRNYAVGNFIASTGHQMLGIAIGYEIFQRTHSATALGLIGLFGAVPIVLLSIPAGLAADRINRKTILLCTQLLAAFTALGLALVSSQHLALGSTGLLGWATAALYRLAAAFGEGDGVSFEPAIPVMYGLLLLNGIVRAFGWAARGALFPNLIPRAALSNAVMWNSSNFETTCILGPPIGGLLITRFGCPTVYLIDAVCALVCLGFLLPIRVTQEFASRHEHPLHDLFSGMRFVRETKVILAVITLDLFAVLLGGATALMPIFAAQILHVGAVGLGFLRAAPSVGAVTMAFILAHSPPLKHAGKAMLCAVAAYGAAMIGFGLSNVFWLSFLMLLLTGAFDNVSVVVRHTLVQWLTPDAMRGRVSAVNNIFIGSSNELGAFESGATAALFGPVLSVVGGGIGTILIVLGIYWKWPEVRRLGPLQAPTPTE